MVFSTLLSSAFQSRQKIKTSVEKFEIHGGRGSPPYRFTIQQEWTVAPLLDVFYGSRHQLDWNRFSAQKGCRGHA
jgi:hypothetical protein